MIGFSYVEVSDVRPFVAREWVVRLFPRGCRVWVTPGGFSVLWFTRLGFLYSGTWREFQSPGFREQQREVWQVVHGGPMKRKDPKKLVASRTHADPSDLVKTFPHLAEFFTAAVFDGSNDPRESPTVTLWCSGGLWRASVKDRAEGLVLWLSAPGVLELLHMLEDFCLSAEAPWRHDDQSHERNGKRVKK